VNAILGIIRLGLRSAAHSRLLATLAVLTCAVAVGMPLTVSGDGSADGSFRVMQTYSLGAIWLLLSVTTLWASGAFISGEIEDRSLRLVMVRPIRAWQVWLGKWLAMLIVNAGLLAVAGALVYAVSFGTLARRPELAGTDGRTTVADLRTAWLAVGPDIPPPDRDIAILLNTWGERGMLPEDPDGLARAARAARREVLARRSTAAPGTGIAWTFPPTAAQRRLLRQAPPLRLRFAYTTSPFDRQFVSGVWRLAAGDGEPVEIETSGLFDGRHAVELPAGLLDDLRTGDVPLHVAFHNAPEDQSIAVMFHADTPVELLAPAGHYAGALLKVLLLMLGVMGVLAALGLTAGALFSSPVALFTSVGLLMAFAVANSRTALDIEAVAPPHGTVAARLHRAGGHLLRGVRAISTPALRQAPLQALADGRSPVWPDVGRALVMLLGFYPFILGGLGGWMLGRRQLAR